MNGIGPISPGMGSASPDTVFPSAGSWATVRYAATNTPAPAQNLAYWTWMPLGGPGKVVRVGVEVTTGVGGSTIRVGIYAAGADGRPGALIVDGGTVAGDTPGLIEATVNVMVAPPGIWLCAVRQGAGAPNLRASLGGHAGGILRDDTGTVITQYPLNCWSNSAVSGALPDPAPAILVGDIGTPLVVVKFG